MPLETKPPLHKGISDPIPTVSKGTVNRRTYISSTHCTGEHTSWQLTHSHMISIQIDMEMIGAYNITTSQKRAPGKSEKNTGKSVFGLRIMNCAAKKS